MQCFILAIAQNMLGQLILQHPNIYHNRLYMDSSDSGHNNKLPSRDYKCPCGKTYLSNAAIFTHIRQKHNGIPPGQIQKPVKPNKPRGRPPLNSKQKASPNSSASHQAPQQTKNNSSYQQFSKLFQMMNNQLPAPQIIPENIWETIDTFQIFDRFIDSQSSGVQPSYTGCGACVGTGLSEFLEALSKESKPHQFSEVLILLILLLQYCLDETNDYEFIQNSSIEQMVFHMNSFITIHILDYAQLLGLHNLWALQLDNITRIFNCFVEWLKWKTYINKVEIWLIC